MSNIKLYIIITVNAIAVIVIVPIFTYACQIYTFTIVNFTAVIYSCTCITDLF